MARVSANKLEFFGDSSKINASFHSQKIIYLKKDKKILCQLFLEAFMSMKNGFLDKMYSLDGSVYNHPQTWTQKYSVSFDHQKFMIENISRKCSIQWRNSSINAANLKM